MSRAVLGHKRPVAPRKTSRTTKPAARRSGAPTARRPAARRPKTPDALAVLKDDHREVEALFTKFEALGRRAHKTKADLVHQMTVALSKHAAIEEQVFYPEVRRAVSSLGDEVLEALEEHHVVKWTLSELEGMTPEDERFQAKVTVLMENVRHHVREEERGPLPAGPQGDGCSAAPGARWGLQAAKDATPTRPHPRSPDTPPGNVIAAALVTPARRRRQRGPVGGRAACATSSAERPPGGRRDPAG